MKKPIYEPISFDSTASTAFLKERLDSNAPWHYHPGYELTLILNGKGIRFIGHTIENFGNNDLLLIGPNLPHCWKNSEKVSAVVIQWEETFMAAEWSKRSEFAHVRNLLQLSKKGLRFNERVAQKLKDDLIKLTTVSPIKKLILLLDILNELSQAEKICLLEDDKFHHSITSNDTERISKVHDYITKHYNKKITLKDIASHVSMTEEYFSRYFKKMMKKTFSVFISEYRINIACQLLIETDMQVSQICYSCGYESLPFFYKQFKKIKKSTPMAYKLRYQELFSK